MKIFINFYFWIFLLFTQKIVQINDFHCTKTKDFVFSLFKVRNFQMPEIIVRELIPVISLTLIKIFHSFRKLSWNVWVNFKHAGKYSQKVAGPSTPSLFCYFSFYCPWSHSLLLIIRQEHISKIFFPSTFKLSYYFNSRWHSSQKFQKYNPFVTHQSKWVFLKPIQLVHIGSKFIVEKFHLHIIFYLQR